MKKISMIITLSLLLFLDLNSWAQSDAREIVALEEVVVTAGRTQEKKRDVVANVTVIDDEEIKASTAHDLGDLLAEKGNTPVSQPL